MRKLNLDQITEVPQENTDPFFPHYPLAQNDPVQEDPDKMLEQIGVLTDFIRAFEGSAVAMSSLAESHGQEIINSIFPNFPAMENSVKSLPVKMTEHLTRLQRNRQAVIDWQKLSREEQIRQRDILVQLINLWDLIYKTGLRASTPGFVQKNFSTSLIAANIDDLKKNIEAEFTGLYEELKKPCYLANFLKIPYPQFLDQDFTLAKLWEVATPPWAGNSQPTTGDSTQRYNKF